MLHEQKHCHIGGCTWPNSQPQIFQILPNISLSRFEDVSHTFEKKKELI